MSDWSDSDSEFLEITAIHGTQAVFVKQEKETSTVSGEIEVNNSAKELINQIEAIEQESNINNDVLVQAVESVPIIYTTRLEQMNAFKDIGNRLNSKEIVEMILNESKPLFKQLPQQIKQVSNYKSHKASYINLCNQVKELNIKARNEATIKYKLKKMCKPVKIVLEDICKKNQSVISKETEVRPGFHKLGSKILRNEAKNEMELSSAKNENLESYQDRLVDEVATSKFFPYTNMPSTDSRDTSLATVAVKHKNSQLADIFIVDVANGVKSFYRTNMSECNKLKKSHKCQRTVVIEYCCWVNREKCIKKLIQTGFFSFSISMFLRKPHNCSVGNCSCCCINYPLLPTASSNVEFIKKPSKCLNTVIEFGDILIQKAMNYVPKEPDILPKSIEPISYLKCAVIIMKYQGVIFRQTHTLGENYEIGNSGDIDMYEKPIVNRSASEEIDCYRQMDNTLGINRIYKSNLVCCWQKRDHILNELNINNYIKRSTLRFMKTPHRCESDNCICCCRQGNITVMEIITNLKNTLVYNKKRIVVKIPLKDENEIVNTTPMLTIPAQTNLSHDVAVQKKSSNNNLPAQSLQIESEIDLTKEESIRKNTGHKTISQRRTFSKRTYLKQNEIKTSLMPKLTLTPKPVQTRIPKQTPKPIPTLTPKPISTLAPKTTPTPLYPIQTRIPTHRPTLQSMPSSTPASDGLINGVLDKFKNIKLTVNDKGKLTAVISASVEKLTAVEIKVLSDILTHAAAQIVQLGIDPKEFCNRVNSSRAANGFLSMSIPQLVGISTVVNQTAMNSSGIRNEKIRAPVNKSNVYQLMSDLGGQKNINIVNSFNSIGMRAKNRVSQDKLNISVPKIVSVYTLSGTESKSTEDSAAAVSEPVATNKSAAVSLTTIPTLPFNQRGTLYPVISVAGLNQSMNVPQPIITGTDGVLRYHTNKPISTSNLNQNIAFIPGISVVANNPAGPAPIQNPMLIQMLEQESSNPPALAPLSIRPDPKQMRVKPLILAHSKPGPLGKVKRRRGNASNAKEPANKRKKQTTPAKSNINEINMDIETSLKTNVIQLVSTNQKTPRDKMVDILANSTIDDR